MYVIYVRLASLVVGFGTLVEYSLISHLFFGFSIFLKSKIINVYFLLPA